MLISNSVKINVDCRVVGVKEIKLTKSKKPFIETIIGYGLGFPLGLIYAYLTYVSLFSSNLLNISLGLILLGAFVIILIMARASLRRMLHKQTS